MYLKYIYSILFNHSFEECRTCTVNSMLFSYYTSLSQIWPYIIKCIYFYNFKFNALFTLQQHKTEISRGALVSTNIILYVVIL